jgi:putative phosphoesterase
MARSATSPRVAAAPKIVHARKELRLSGRSSRIIAVADTHGRPHPALPARIDELAPAHILHAGDVGDLAVLRALETHAPVTAVRGNIDGRGLPDFVTLGVQSDGGADGETARLTILLTHIAVYGLKLRADVARIAQGEDAALVVCGHSHIPFAAHDRGITVFNPGSVGPRRFQLPIVLGVIDVSAGGASCRHVDCETGLAWKPGSHG